MRTIAGLLLLAAAATAQDDVVGPIRAALDRGAPEEALALADAALERYPDQRKTVTYVRAQAQTRIARAMQREKGYSAALAYLEQDLTHPLIAQAYGELCLWEGLEERGIERLRACGLPKKHVFWPQCTLLWNLRRFDDIIALAEGVPGTDWPEYAAAQKKLRAGLHDRARRGTWVALIAAAALLLGCGALYRLAPTPTTNAIESS